MTTPYVVEIYSDHLNPLRKYVLAFADSHEAAAQSIAVAIQSCPKYADLISIPIQVKQVGEIWKFDKAMAGLPHDLFCERLPFDISSPHNDEKKRISLQVTGPKNLGFWEDLLYMNHQRLRFGDRVEILVRRHFGKPFVDQPEAPGLMRIALWAIAHPDFAKVTIDDCGDYFTQSKCLRDIGKFLNRLPLAIERESLLRSLASPSAATLKPHRL